MPDSILAITLYAWLGWLVATSALGVLWVLTGYLGALLYKRLRRIYSMMVIGYWLDRFERKGHATFKNQEETDGE